MRYYLFCICLFFSGMLFAQDKEVAPPALTGLDKTFDDVDLTSSLSTDLGVIQVAVLAVGIVWLVVVFATRGLKAMRMG